MRRFSCAAPRFAAALRTARMTRSSPHRGTRPPRPGARRKAPAPTRGARLSALHLAPDSLGFALDAAAQAVGAVRGGSALPAALTALHTKWPAATVPLARGAVQDIAYRTLRRLGAADRLVARFVRKPPPAHVTDLLACALALLLDPADSAAYAEHTVVDQAVDAIAARREHAFAKGLVNAVLRGFLRERTALVAELESAPVARWNYPTWWIDAVRRARPDDWQAVLAAGNKPGPLTLRVNTRRTTLDAYL